MNISRRLSKLELAFHAPHGKRQVVAVEDASEATQVKLALAPTGSRQNVLIDYGMKLPKRAKLMEAISCKHCGHVEVRRDGKMRGKQRYSCRACQ